MKIALLAAMSAERAQIQSRLSGLQTDTTFRTPLLSGRLGRAEILLCETGMGKVNAAVALAEVVGRYRPDCVISTGVAGGLDASLAVADIVATTEIAYHDVDFGPGNVLGQVQGLPPRFASDPAMVAAARALPSDLRVFTGLQVSGDAFITSAEKRDRIKADFPEALSVDMESGALAQTCHLYGIPFISFRVISDTPGATGDHARQYTDFWAHLAGRSLSVTRSYLDLLVNG